MSASGSEPVFLERQTYRVRRLHDAARVLPVIGALLFALPLLWAGPGASTARGYLYVFAAWTLLILIAALLSRRIARRELPQAAAPEGD